MLRTKTYKQKFCRTEEEGNDFDVKCNRCNQNETLVYVVLKCGERMFHEYGNQINTEGE